MRIIKYPPPKEEKKWSCSCGAELGYIENDCFWKNGITGDLKLIVCPCCRKENIIDTIPYPMHKRKREFYEEM